MTDSMVSKKESTMAGPITVGTDGSEPAASAIRWAADEAARRGLGGFTGLMLGAIGQRVAGHVAAPVIVVRGDATGGQDEVVVGVDPAEENDTVLTYASEAAFRRGALLRIVHGLTIPPMYLETGYFPLANEIEQEVGTSLKSLADTWQARYPEIKVVEHLVREHPVHALVKASAHADLVVVGSRSRIGLGSTSHGAIHHAACPVAVIRTRS